MAKKKKPISTIELFIWKFTGFLLVVAWVIAITFTILFSNQYGLDDLGVRAILYFLSLILLLVSYVTLYVCLARLKLHGSKRRIAGMSMLIIMSVPLTVMVADFIAITNSGNPWALSFPVGLVIGFADFMLFKKLRP